MKVSIIIPSLNGDKHLPTLMQSLESQKNGIHEVIVVLDGSSDRSNEVLNNWREKLPLHVIDQKNQGRSGARNRGAEIAQGELLIFYDDDMVPSIDSVRAHRGFHNRMPKSILAGAVIEDPTCQTEICLWREWLHQRWMGQDESFRRLDEKSLALSAANLSIPKDVFEFLHGFDEGLKDCEDFDLAVRAYSEEVSVYYDPENKAIHNGFESIRSYAIRQREYRKSQEKLLEIRSSHPRSDLYWKYHTPKKKLLSVLYYFIPGSLLKLCDHGKIRFLPTPLRFQFYSRIFSALTVYYPNRTL